MEGKDGVEVGIVDKKILVTAAPVKDNEDGGSKYSSNEQLALYEEDMGVMQTLAGFLKTFTAPISADVEQPRKRPKLGTMLGIYLPTIQHIFGVIMFLRLYHIVGSCGILESFGMVSLCCLCTFLTSISMSAIATNGVVESGGSYFMISRNLGPECGTAVGILFYLANTVATSMYLVGGVEILLTYVGPDLPQFGSHEVVHHGGSFWSAKFNNFRLYGTGLLLIEFAIVACGVKFVQMFAPLTLLCVIISILSIFIGSFVANPANSPEVCVLGERLLKRSVVIIDNVFTCNWTKLNDHYCNASSDSSFCDDYFKSNEISVIKAVPGFSAKNFKDNLWSVYMKMYEAYPNQKANQFRDVYQDMTATFFILLGIYFPSVTGIMTGSNMSGDLRDPQKSIPIGTLSAQLTTSFVYLSFVLIFGGTISHNVLLDKYGDSVDGGMIAAKLSWPNPWVLKIGSFTSTLGAGLQCLCSAPRLLQSIAKDDVIPFMNVFKVLTRFGEPFRALLVTLVIAELSILIGNLDHIAPLVDYCFLMCYTVVNIVCAMQTLLKAPNWRPRFKYYHWTLSVAGAFCCLFIMFAAHWYYALATLILCIMIYKYVEYRGAEKEWGDGFKGLALSSAQYSLQKLETEDVHTKNWRPQLLVMTKLTDDLQPKYHQLLSFAHHIKAGRGLVIFGAIHEGDYGDKNDRQKRKQIIRNIRATLKAKKIKGFIECVVCQRASEGLNILIQTAGVGALEPNTVVVGWPTSWKERDDRSYYNFLDSVHRVASSEKCLLIPKGIELFPDRSDRVSGTIDAWWIMHDGGLLLLLPFLLRQSRAWRRCKTRIHAVATQTDNNISMKKNLIEWLYKLRIDAEVHVVEMPAAEVTAYMHEKTIQMEERLKFMQELHLGPENVEVQSLMDKIRQTRQARSEQISELAAQDEDSKILTESEMSRLNEYTFTPMSKKNFENLNNASRNIQIKEPMKRHSDDNKTMKKLHSAVKLNMAIRDRSADAQLVIINLPGAPKNKASLVNYIDYLETLTEGLDRVLLVRGTGKEVVTMYM